MADDSVVETGGAEESVSHSEYDGGRPRYAYMYLVLYLRLGCASEDGESRPRLPVVVVGRRHSVVRARVEYISYLLSIYSEQPYMGTVYIASVVLA